MIAIDEGGTWWDALPERVAAVADEDVEAVLGALEQARAALWRRLTNDRHDGSTQPSGGEAEAGVARVRRRGKRDRLLTVKEAAVFAGVKAGTVYDWLRARSAHPRGEAGRVAPGARAHLAERSRAPRARPGAARRWPCRAVTETLRSFAVERIKHLRKSRGLSLTDVARLAGLHSQAVARVERKGTDPRASTLAAVARALGVPVCELFHAREAGHAKGRRRRRR